MLPGNRTEITHTSPKFKAAVPSDSTVLTGVRALYATEDGNIIADDHDGNTDVVFPVLAGQQVNIQPSKVKLASSACNLLF